MTGIGGQSEVGHLHRVLLKHPGEAFPAVQEIETESERLGYGRPPDPREASEEHDALCHLLSRLGAEVQLLPAHSRTGMDSVFVRDASILTDQGMVICRMGKEARRGEPAAQEEFFRSAGIPLLGAIHGEGHLEGGDFVWIGPGVAAVGRGYRTNDEGIRQLWRLLEGSLEELVVVPLPHWRGPGDVFHLMSVLSPLDRDLALVYSPLLPVPFRELLLDRGLSLVEVADEEFESMGCNVLAVAPRVCVMLEGNPETRRRLTAVGVEVHTYRGEEISVPGAGGPTCLTRPLLRAD